ncbi:phage tail protein [Sphingopyxis sp.]|uniref:GTA baseplate fiber-binding domain-containing protein n=1 Tax=Sphingopyxis sp. TaxID=1908224 RepID=UPI0026080D71|nr:phage tail protein [Sphingopyxis sp.]MCW0200028.1 phage tail protein [Sphingopyxis sp.]
MATLVLTVVGGIVGGPVGAAVGAAIGQQVDAAIFKPKGREGPRLADLKVQASTYGQQIPGLFGTMRVAGSVIWATDLIERRNKRGGGKGRPSTTEYSYAVSLAVALSSRRVGAIRRIWADGNLLRGSSGSFQERCTFRWYDGSEDQPVDPLIASAVGAASASAFRGLSYAVFEELELGAFGNRIPSLTFEVEADAGAVDAGGVGDALLGEAGRCGGRWPIAGYAASGDRVRDALAPLFEIDGTRLVSDPAGWRLAPAEIPPDPSAFSDFCEAARVLTPADCSERRRAPLSALPGTIRLRHYEPERDYQLGQQAAAVAGGGAREERIDLPAVLSAGSARALARALAAAAADGRETLIWAGDLAALALPVGGPIAWTDGGVWRVASRTVRGSGVSIELRRFQPASTAVMAADPGLPVGSPDWPDAEASVRLFDLPNIGAASASAPRLIVAAAGSNDGWRGADLWFQPETDAEPIAFGTARPAAALGVLGAALPAGGTLLFDRSSVLMVTLINPSMTLESVDERALLGGANRAMAGDELLQFGLAEMIGPATWRLSNLLRGRNGTAAAARAAGTPFVLLDDPALLPIPDDLARFAEAGAAILQWASRSETAIDAVPVPAARQALVPLAPVHGAIRRDGAGGVELRWIRRTRTDAGWRDHVDVPLGEGREAWRVAVEPAVMGIGPWETASPSLTLDAATWAALAPESVFSIRQAGDFALSEPLLLPLTE